MEINLDKKKISIRLMQLQNLTYLEKTKALCQCPSAAQLSKVEE